MKVREMFNNAIKDLLDGKITTIKPHGNSMKGKIESGNTVELSPCKPEDLCVGDIVLSKVNGNIYVHLIKAIRKNKNSLQFQIGNNKGGINGWTSIIYGKVISVGR